MSRTSNRPSGRPRATSAPPPRADDPPASNLDTVIADIRERILSAGLPPGTWLRQEELAATLGTTRVAVREALRILETDGLVRSEAHRGFVVSELDADQVEEIYDLRIALESHAVRLAIPLLTAEDLAALDALHGAMAQEEDPDSRLAIRERFHARLYDVTARPRLIAAITRLRQDVARSVRWRMIDHSPRYHDAFFEAVRDGDADLACAELAAHYRKIGALLQRFLREAKNGSIG
jgi:DNA-binding GntR family transcriptional regulator